MSRATVSCECVSSVFMIDISGLADECTVPYVDDWCASIGGVCLNKLAGSSVEVYSILE